MIPNGQYAVGVDMGATTIKTGAVDLQGRLLDHVSVETMADRGPHRVLEQLVSSVEEIFRTHPREACAGIGIGSPGVVRVEEGSVHYPPNFADWTDVEVLKEVRRTFSIPLAIENDANCAAIAEARYGAGREHKDFLFVIWGTGIGGGVILDRRIHRGPSGAAGEVGHVTIDYNGPQCNCGSRGCIESYLGQRYLSQRTKDKLAEYLRLGKQSALRDLVGGDLDAIEPALISRAAEAGDSFSIEVLREAGELLGVALASVFNVLDLHVAVIGGGISAVPRFVFDEMERSARERVLAPHRPDLRIVRALLQNDAGIIGAASLVL